MSKNYMYILIDKLGLFAIYIYTYLRFLLILYDELNVVNGKTDTDIFFVKTQHLRGKDNFLIGIPHADAND